MTRNKVSIIALCIMLIAIMIMPVGFVDADSTIVVNVYPDNPGLTVNSSTFDGICAHGDDQWSGAGDMFAKPRYNALKLSWERKFVDMNAFKPTRSGAYTWTSTDAVNFYSDIRLLKNTNTKILLCMDYVPSWMPSYENAGIFPSDPNYYNDYADIAANIVKHCIVDEGLTNIQAIQGPNELATMTYTPIHPYDLTNIYSSIRSTLNGFGLSSVKIAGPDMYVFNNPGLSNSAFLAIDEALECGPQLYPYLDIFDWHYYYNENAYEPTGFYVKGEQDFIEQMDGLTWLIRDYAPANVSGYTPKKLWLTEFNEWTQTTAPTFNDKWQHLPWMVIDAMNHGQAAVFNYELSNITLCRPKDACCGMWNWWQIYSSDDPNDPAINYTNYATKQSYYVYQMMSAHILPGSKVLDNDHKSNEASSKIRISAVKSSTGLYTFLVYNMDNVNPQTVKINVSGVTGKTLYKYEIDPNNIYNTYGDYKCYEPSTILLNNSFTDTLPAGGFAVYTEVNNTANAPQKAWEFSKDGLFENEGWQCWSNVTINNNSSTPDVVNGIVHVNINGAGGIIGTLPGLNINISSSSSKWVQIKIKNETSATSASLWWGTTQNCYEITITGLIPNSINWQIINIDLRNNPNWNGTLDSLGLRPANEAISGISKIGYIRIQGNNTINPDLDPNVP